jgi:hypothetical protein
MKRMDQGTAWKAAAVVFACSTAFLLWRGASREDAVPVPTAASPGHVDSLPPRAVRRVSDPAPPGEGAAEIPVAREAAAPPTAPPAAAPQAGAESAEELLLAIASSPDRNAWNEGMQRLLARRDEALPLVERLMRESQAAGRCGVPLEALFRAYARLAGVAAVPLLEQRGAADGAAMPPAVAALCLVRDPEAVAAIRRLQSRLEGNDMGVDPSVLALSGSPFRELVREWAETPPANQPWLRVPARDALWHNGGPEAKEWVWSTATTEDRERLLGWINGTSPAPWPDRLRASVRDGLASDDGKRRALAAYRVAQAPALFDDDTYAAAKNALAPGAQPATGEAGELPRLAKERFAAEDARREREAQLRAILGGR